MRLLCLLSNIFLLLCAILKNELCGAIITPDQNQQKPVYTSGIKAPNWKNKKEPLTVHNYSKVFVHNNPDGGAQYVIAQTERSVKVYPVYNGHSYGPREEESSSQHHNKNRTIYKRKIEYKTFEVYEKCPSGATGQFVYASSCNQFLNCWKGRGSPQNCPAGTLFNPKTLECDFPDKVECITGSSSTILTPNIRVPKSVSQPSCPQEFAGLIPNYTDCSKFISCNNGQSVTMDCAPGTLFDTKQNICDFPHNALCFDGKNGQFVYENLSGHKGQTWVQGSSGQSGTYSGTQTGFTHQGSGTHGLGYSESSYQAAGIHSGAVSEGNIQGYRGVHYGGGFGSHNYQNINSKLDYGEQNQNINSKLDFGAQNTKCISAECTRGQTTTVLGYNNQGCDPTVQQCNNVASHNSRQNQNNCNPQNQNCNIPNTRYVSNTVIRTQQGGQTNRNVGSNIPSTHSSTSGSGYIHPQGTSDSNQYSRCNPQTERCLSVSTSQGIIYIPSTGISQQGVTQSSGCSPNVQNCGHQNTGQTRFPVTSQLPKCSQGTQNCGSQSNNQNTGYGTNNNQHVGGFQAVGTDSLASQQSGCTSSDQNCGQSHSQSQDHRYGSNAQIGSSLNKGEGFYDSHAQYGTGSQSQYYGSIDRHHFGHADNSGHSSSYGQSSNPNVGYTTGTSHTSYGRIENSAEPKCPDGYQGITKHPTDCGKFLNCANGRTFIQDCAEGTLFNPVIGNCDFPYNVDCKTTETNSGGSHVSDSNWNQNRRDYGEQSTKATTQTYVLHQTTQPYQTFSRTTTKPIGGHYIVRTTPQSGRNQIHETNRGESGFVNREKNVVIDEETSSRNPIQRNDNPDYIDIFNPADNSFGFKASTTRSVEKLWPPPYLATDLNADYVFEYEDGEPVTIEPDNIFLADKQKKTNCGKEDFYCSSTMCITKSMVCDGHKDCANGKDEQFCEEYNGRFTKTPNAQLEVMEKQKWINVSATTCALLCIQTTQFKCRSFNFRRVDDTCFLSDMNVGLTGALRKYYPVDYYELKIGTVDCSDNSINFECSNKKCIKKSQLCDGSDDCGNRQDEKNCKASDFGYSLKLAGSTNKNEGRVEVTVFGQTGYICDDNFGILEANVICKELGFDMGAVEVKGQSYFAKDIKEENTLYMMDDLECIGNETTVLDCNFAGWGVHNCRDMEIAGIVCKTQQEKCAKGQWKCATGNECVPIHFLCDDTYDCTDDSDESTDLCESPTEIRLVNGSNNNEGRLEIKRNGVWGTICDDDFNEDAAKVVCKKLGYSGKSIVKKDSFFGAGDGPIWLDQVSCYGNETSLEDCTHWGWGEHNCDHTEDVGVICMIDDLEVPAARHSKQSTHLEFDPGLPKRCGIRKDSIFLENDLVHARVIGGSVAKKGDYPWQAAIKVKVKDKSAHWCGAVVISSKWVLTAAHCLQGYSKGAYIIVAGEYNTDEDEGTEQTKYIDEFYLHEDFRKVHKMNNDIALIRLKGTGFILNDDIQAICLPDEDADYKGNCTISGFGTVKSGTSGYSHNLMATWIPIQSDEICKMAHIYGEHLTDGMFCAGFLDGGFDACDGDSGGPLACLDQGFFTLYGLTSWGQHCGYANKPGVYVKVAHYRKWIEDTIQKNQQP